MPAVEVIGQAVPEVPVTQAEAAVEQ